MAEKTSWTGAALTESDINTYLSHTAGEWNSWVPVVTQYGPLAVEIVRARYWRSGRLVVADGLVRVISRGVTGSQITIGLPVAAAMNTSPYIGAPIGSGVIYDVSPSLTTYICTAGLLSSTTFGLLNKNGQTMGDNTYSLPDPDDIFTFTLMYQAAS